MGEDDAQPRRRLLRGAGEAISRDPQGFTYLRRSSRPNSGCSLLPITLIGRTAPAFPFLKKGSTAFRSTDLYPVVICETLASVRAIPWKSSASSRRLKVP